MNEQELFNQWQPLAHKIANSFSRKYPHYQDEIRNAALMGLWESAKLDKENKARDFKKFTSGVIKNTILNELTRIHPLSDLAQRKLRKGEINVSYYSIDARDEKDIPNPFMVMISNMTTESFEDIYNDLELKEKLLKAIDNALKKVDKDDRKIIREHYLKGKEMSEIGKASGVTRSRIHQKKNRGIKVIKEYLEERFTAEELKVV